MEGKSSQRRMSWLSGGEELACRNCWLSLAKSAKYWVLVPSVLPVRKTDVRTTDSTIQL